MLFCRIQKVVASECKGGVESIVCVGVCGAWAEPFIGYLGLGRSVCRKQSLLSQGWINLQILFKSMDCKCTRGVGRLGDAL